MHDAGQVLAHAHHHHAMCAIIHACMYAHLRWLHHRHAWGRERERDVHGPFIGRICLILCKAAPHAMPCPVLTSCRGEVWWAWGMSDEAWGMA